MWNCMKHDYFGHSSCNQESWAVCCSLGWGHRHPQQLVWECQAWSNTKEEAARLKLFVTLERAWQLCCAQPCQLQQQRTGCRTPEGSTMARQGTGRWRGGHSTYCCCLLSLLSNSQDHESWQPQEQKLLQMLRTLRAWLRAVSPSYRKRSPHLTHPLQPPHQVWRSQMFFCPVFWEKTIIFRVTGGGAAQFTLLISEMSLPSLGMYTFWLLALILLWMVKSSTSRFPFSVNLNKIFQDNWVTIKLSLLLRYNHRIMD